MMGRRWWWRVVGGLLMLAGAVGGCGGGDHAHDGGVSDAGVSCLLFNEVEPNATAATAQFLSDVVVDDCFIVQGSLFDVIDVDSYRVLVQEDLTLVATLDHSAAVDFDLQFFEAESGQLIRDCGVGVVPEVCAVTFDVRGRDIAVDIVVTSAIGAGGYTLTLQAQ
jgi:hypothetical protein